MQNKPTIEVLICTLDSGIDSVINNMLPSLDGVLVTISHQLSDEKYLLNRKLADHVQYVSLMNLGLSRNRNNALFHARGDVCVIADDDIKYIKDFKTKIESAYEKHPDAAAITFQAVGMERWEKDFEHNWRTVGQVASWMVTFDRKKIIDNGIQFDEKFGLGAQYPQGEENIFLADMRAKGLLVRSSSEMIVEHQDISSGYIFDNKKAAAKTATVIRMYGWFPGLLSVGYFTYTKRPLYKQSGMSSFAFLKAAMTPLFRK